MIHYITTNGIGQAWVTAELRVMERKGVPCVLHAMRQPHLHFFRSAWASRINEATRLIYPMPVIGTAVSLLMAPILFRGRFLSGLLNALFGKRESLRVRISASAHFFVACHWARQLRRDDVSLIHAQWIHSAGTIGMYGAWLLGVPFSFTGHAVDLFRERVALEDKVRRSDFIVCISSFHRDLYRTLGAREEQLHLVYCGIDLDQFEFAPRPVDERPRILSIGRLVEKKGFEVLIDACAILKQRGVDCECVIAGEGPLAASLKKRVDDRDVRQRVTVTGRKVLQEELSDWMGTGHIFAQPCVWASDSDVDGTPRTLMEAMACGLAAVATRLTGIPDIIEDGRSGRLVDPNDAEGLAGALQELIADETLRRRIAEGGRKRVEEKFQIDRCLEPLAALFRKRIEEARGGTGLAHPVLGDAVERSGRAAEATT